MSSFVEIIHISTLVIMIIAGFLAVVFKKLLPSIIALSAEAAIGAGLTMAIFIFAIRGTR